MIPAVHTQHLDTAIHLANVRPRLLRGPHVSLRQLRRSDDRLAAHLDGLIIAGDHGRRFVESALEEMSAATVFVACACATFRADREQIARLLSIVETCPDALPGLTAAFGWAEQNQLQGVVLELLDHTAPVARLVGLAACGWHRVNPGLRLVRGFEDPDAGVRARALRTAGEIGLQAMVATCAAAVADPSELCRFWAAWSAVLLGDRGVALEAVAQLGSAPGGMFQARAFGLAVQAMSVSAARDYVLSAAPGASNLRRAIRGAGLVGDPVYVPGLLDFTTHPTLARLAGEAFSLITGADLSRLDLETKPPEKFESGPNDNPDDPNVDMDEDDGLPWPDRGRLESWWQANSERFQPGVRYFMGEPLNVENCRRVLQVGQQRQRMAAAVYLSLLNPGTPLFEWRAPAWRQQRLLAS